MEVVLKDGTRGVVEALLETVHKLITREDIPRTAGHILKTFVAVNLGLTILDLREVTA